MKQSEQKVEIVHPSNGPFRANSAQKLVRGSDRVCSRPCAPHHCHRRCFSSRRLADRLRRRRDQHPTSERARRPPPDAGAPAPTPVRRRRNSGPTASSQPGPRSRPSGSRAGQSSTASRRTRRSRSCPRRSCRNVGKDFGDFDAKRFGSFGCATCHGPKKNEDPHKVLPKLTMSNGGMEKI